MRKISAHTKRKWWYRSIRSMNWFSFRYWWFVWLLFLLAILLFALKCCTHQETKSCGDAYNFNERFRTIDSLLYNCCECATEPEEPEPPTPPEPPVEDPVGTKPCDTEPKSGGAGVTRNTHHLGDEPGVVTITYDMNSQPDKLEVFYEGSLVASTRRIRGNQDGFVGGDNTATCCGSLSFNYVPNRERYCTVVVSGPYGTSWKYNLSCPR